MEAFLIESLSNSQRRWLALSLFLLVILILIMTIIWPIVDQSRQNKQKIESLSMRLQRYKQVAARKQQVVEKLDSSKARLNKNNQFFKSKSYALASADLQQLVKDAIKQAGGLVTSTQVIPETNEGQFDRVAIRVQLSASITALKEILYKVESSRPMLIVDNLRIRSSKGVYDRKLRRRVETDVLTITLEVFGYMQHKEE
ncbi:MAG: type II secretion system protein GspM [Methylococcales bacterium]